MQRTTEKKERASDSFFRRKSLCTLLPCPGLTGLTALPMSVPAGVSLQKSQRLGESSMCVSQMKAGGDKQCTAATISVAGGSWLGGSRSTAVVSKAGGACGAAADPGRPSLPRGCVSSSQYLSQWLS